MDRTTFQREVYEAMGTTGTREMRDRYAQLIGEKVYPKLPHVVASADLAEDEAFKRKLYEAIYNRHSCKTLTACQDARIILPAHYRKEFEATLRQANKTLHAAKKRGEVEQIGQMWKLLPPAYKSIGKIPPPADRCEDPTSGD